MKKWRFNRTHKKRLILESIIGFVIIFLLILNSILYRKIISAQNNIDNTPKMHWIYSLMIVWSDWLSEEVVYENIIIKVDAPAWAFPEWTELRIIPITQQAQQQEIKEKLENHSNKITQDSQAISFDISFIWRDENWEEIELEPAEWKTVKISFNYRDNETFSNADRDSTREIKIYHLEERTGENWYDTNETEVKEILINEDESSEWELVVDAEKFSIYTIVDQLREETGNQLAEFKYGVITISWWTNNNTCYTFMDRNLWATGNDINNVNSYGYYYQHGNNYGFTLDTARAHPSSTRVSTSYQPSQYSGNTFISVVNRYTVNGNLWWWSSDYANNSATSLNTSYSITTGRQWPCPDGWHVPAAQEWVNVLKYWFAKPENASYTLTTNTQGWAYFAQASNWIHFQEWANIPNAWTIVYSTQNYASYYWSGWYLWTSSFYFKISGKNYNSKGATLKVWQNYIWLYSNQALDPSYAVPIRCFYNSTSCSNIPEPTISDGGESCDLPRWWTVEDWTTVTWYQSASVPYGQSCVSTGATCNNWEWSVANFTGNYQYSWCEVQAPANCSFQWQTILHGSGLTVYSTASTTCPTTCTTWTVTCNNWTPGWDIGYTSLSCSLEPVWCNPSYNLSSTGANGTYSSCTPYTANGNSCSAWTTLYKLDSCNNGYHTEDNETCISNTRNVSCAWSIPSNAVAKAWHGTFTQTWNGSTWTPSTKDWTYDAWECGYECDNWYHRENSACVSNSKDVACDASGTPANATADSYNVTITWNNWWSSPTPCTWSCNANFHTEDSTSCTWNTKQVQCTEWSRPANSSYVYRMVQISWQWQRNNWNWSTADDCAWACNEHFHTWANNNSCEIDRFQITWKNSDGTTLEIDTWVAYSTTPHYDWATPTSGWDAQYSYTFSGWSPAISAVNWTATYTAVYTQTINTYTVTWQNDDGSVLETDTDVPYWTMPTYDWSTPQKTGSLIYSYAFSGWSPAISEVHWNQTYTAQYSQTTRKYDITWRNIDWTTLETDNNVAYWSTPSYDWATPTNWATNEYVTSTFSWWNPTPTTVESDAEYMARYIYTLTSGYVLDTSKPTVYLTLNGNGWEFTNDSGLYVLDYEYYNTGELMYSHSSNYSDDWIRSTAASSSDSHQYLTTITWAQYLYVNVAYDLQELWLWLFSSSKDKLDIYAWKTTSATAVAHLSWNTNAWIQGNENYIVSGDSVLFDFSLANRTISSMESNWFYAAIVWVIPVWYMTEDEFETPSREWYTFQWWYTQAEWWEQVNINNLTMTESREIFAHWTINTYTITWKNDDGSIIDTTTWNYQTMPTHSNPTKTWNAQYTYVFTGWSPSLSTITWDITYTAVYDSIINQYTATIVAAPEWYGTVSSPSVTKDYNSIITINDNQITIWWTTVTATPTARTDEYTYTFSGWVNTCGNNWTKLTWDCTITAQFSRSTNEYLITFENRDWDILKSWMLEYWQTPSAPTDPSRESTPEFSYSFSWWIPEIVSVVWTATYTAEFTSTLNQYTATIIAEPEWYWTVSPTTVTKDYNSTITINDNQITIDWTTVTATPTASGAQYTYTFSGWVNTCGNNWAKLTWDCTITAQFERMTNEYVITFYDRDWWMLRLDMVEYWDTPEYSGANPVKQSDEDYVYEFIWWSPNILPVTWDMDYMAVYESYTIPHINFVSPTPINNAEITWNRFTTKIEISNTDNISNIEYEINHESFDITLLNYWYNFDNVAELWEITNTRVKSIIGENDGIVHWATRVNSGRYWWAYYFDWIDDYIEFDNILTVARKYSLEYRVKPDWWEWTHIIKVWWWSNYVNWQEVEEIPQEFWIAANLSTVWVDDEWYYFRWLVDEVKVHWALTPDQVQYFYKSNLRKTGTGTWEFETINTCLDITWTYTYSIEVQSPHGISTSTWRSLTTNIPWINVEWTWYDFWTYVSTWENLVLTWTMWTLSVTDYIWKIWWRVYFTTSPALVWQETEEEISTENLKFKANNLIYNPLYEWVQNSLVWFWEGISTTQYNTAHWSTENDNILEYIVRETDENDFMCSQVWVYSDNTEIKLEVPAWQIEDNYNWTLWITLQQE